MLIHHDSAGLFSGEDFGQAMHTDYVGVQDVGELPQTYRVALDLLAHSDDSYPPVGELPSFPLGAPWHID